MEGIRVEADCGRLKMVSCTLLRLLPVLAAFGLPGSACACTHLQGAGQAAVAVEQGGKAAAHDLADLQAAAEAHSTHAGREKQ